MSEKVVVVSFVAKDGDPYTRDRRTGAYVEPRVHGPTLSTLAHPKSPYRGRVSHWYYLIHPAPSVLATRIAGRDGVAVADDLESALRFELPDFLRPVLERVVLNTDAPPNDHVDLFELVKEQLRLVRLSHPDQEIILSLSHGTAPMHAVMFLAGSIGVVGGKVTLVQTERNEGALARPDAPVALVNLKLSSVLQLARTAVPASRAVDAAPSPDFLARAASPRLLDAIRRARALAAVPFPLLVRGERGVGKTTFVSLIRLWSRFRNEANDRNWPAVACGQFQDAQMMRAELCGAKRGAYTGLEHDRKGLVELADGDTLFLDEIQDLAPENQRVIVKLLEDHTFYRLGDEGINRTSKFRLVTGTNLDDTELMKHMRADFFDRLRDTVIEIPPLRECREDLPWMWDVVWGEAAQLARLARAEMSSAQRDVALAVLQRHDLPGNWRDLRRLAARITVMIHQDAKLTNAGLKEVVADFLRDSPGVAASPPAAALSPRDAARIQRLEATLGPECSKVWERTERGESLMKALSALLGSRHRASRAAPLLRRAFPNRAC